MDKLNITWSKIKHLAYLGLVLCWFSTPSLGQDSEMESYDSLLNEYLLFDSLLLAELEAGNSSIAGILDDIINENYIKSQLIVRTGYTSDIINAGRDYGVSQYGLNAGVAYYHKSGLFADVSGYYNSSSEPNYNTTITTAGYMGNLFTNLNYFVSYDHYFFHEADNPDYIQSFPLTNSLNASTTYYVKRFNFGIDYSFLFGEETAHRIRGNISATFDKRNWGFIDRFAVSPNVSVLFGNANVTSTVFNEETAKRRANKLMDRIGRARFAYLYNNYPDELKTLLSETETSNAFGVMNYSIFLPVTFTVNKVTLLLNYSLNFPVALPGETDVDTSPNSYFSASLLFAFSL